MKSPRLLLTTLVVLASASSAWAATAPAPAAPNPVPPTEPPPTPTLPVVTFKLEDYLNDLATAVKLSDSEKAEIQADYVADGNLMKNILNNDSLSPAQKAAQVSDMRDKRNARIDALLIDLVRKVDFHQVEAKYRVALVELAAEGGWVVAPPAPASAPDKK